MKIVTDSTNECKNIMNRNLFIQFKPAINKVAKQLPDIVRNWVEEKVDDSRYRYPSGTYKATLRRQSVYCPKALNPAWTDKCCNSGEHRRNGENIDFNDGKTIMLNV